MPLLGSFAVSLQQTASVLVVLPDLAPGNGHSCRLLFGILPLPLATSFAGRS